jgi:sporulation protein YlmC with PRC-barrel domain
MRYTVIIMLQLSNAFANKAVMSLRTGTPVADVGHPIINPNNLKIEGFYCEDIFNKQLLVLLYQDIREMLPQGFVVDDVDVLMPPAELVRLHDILELNFELIGKPVETQSKEKVGKVADYAVEIETMFIQKLYVSRSMLKSLTTGQLSVDRNNIIEITNRRVVITDLLKTAPAAVTAGMA